MVILLDLDVETEGSKSWVFSSDFLRFSLSQISFRFFVAGGLRLDGRREHVGDVRLAILEVRGRVKSKNSSGCWNFRDFTDNLDIYIYIYIFLK